MAITSVRYADLDWGKTMYIINDLAQFPWTLVGIESRPGKVTKFILADEVGDEIVMYDFQCSLEKTEPPVKPKTDDEEDEE